MAQYSELSHFIFNTKTKTKNSTNLFPLLIALSDVAIGGTRYEMLNIKPI